MAEYIEREALPAANMNDNDYADGWNECLEAINSILAADVRPVITCGECEFWNRDRISCEGLARCNTGESGIRYRNRNDFCSRGKKKEES